MELKHLLLLPLLASCLLLRAADGDVTTIEAHDAVDMTWYGNYDQTVTFPDGATSYRQILMHYKMGCASSQCSDWDYTTSIRAMHNTGVQDSTVAMLDTLSTEPLIVDTTWNVFDVLDPFELGRVITPYGGYMANGQNGFSNAWEHTHTFDVTDFATILEDEVIIRAFYDGWSAGFSVSITFEFIEGPPAREVLDITNYHAGSFGYSNSANVESGPLSPRDYTLPAEAQGARVRVTTTGHGFDNNVSCAEFCERFYNVNMNGTNATGNVVVWNDDCAANSIWPQGGTWVFNRAGWCPGTRGTINEHELTEFVDFAGSNTLDVNMQNYTWSGAQQPSYYMDIQLVSYGAYNHGNDVAITEILAPSTHEDHSRRNPICGNPILEFKNMGGNEVTSVRFFYGIVGAGLCEYEWTGSLAPSASTQVTLPSIGTAGADEADPKFYVQAIAVNGMADEYELDNVREVSIELPPLYDMSKITLNFRTNNRPQDNGITVSDTEGNVYYERLPGTLSSETIYSDDINLSPGCYILHVTDSGLGTGDGLSHWYSSQVYGVSSGYFILRNDIGATIKNFNPDFGSEIYHEFVIGGSYDAAAGNCVTTPVEETAFQQSLKVFPNPSTGLFRVEMELPTAPAEYRVADITGRVVSQGETSDNSFDLDMMGHATGVYFLNIQSAGESVTQQLVLTK